RAPPGRTAGRHQHDRSGGGWHVPLHPLIPHVQFVRRPDDKEEPMVGQGGHVAFKGGLRTATRGPQAHPAPPVARRGRLEREHLAPVQRSQRITAPRLFLWHHLRLPDERGCCADATCVVPPDPLPAADPRGRVRGYLSLDCRAPRSRTSTLVEATTGEAGAAAHPSFFQSLAE